jgi:hypothetical protein
MNNGIEPVVLSVESATRVIEAIEKPMGDTVLVHDYYQGRGSASIIVNGDSIAEEYIDYVERGEFVIPAELKERAARAIIQYRLDRSCNGKKTA